MATECVLMAGSAPLPNILRQYSQDKLWGDLEKREYAVDRHNLEEKDFAHAAGFAGYLRACWDSHAGLVLSPAMLMFVTLAGIAKHIKTNGEAYRELFTGQKGVDGAPAQAKTPMVFLGHSIDTLTVDIIIARLKEELAASGVDVDMFCPQFSDSTDLSREATAACFCEAMEAYFCYEMAMCGIGRVRVCGTAEDWERAAETCEAIGKILHKATVALKEQAAMYRWIWASRQDAEELYNLFRIDLCNSGHDTITGRLVALYNLTTEVRRGADGALTAAHPLLAESARIKIEDSTYDKTWYKTYGVFSSALEGKFLVPRFNSVVLREHVPLSLKRRAAQRGPDIEKDSEYAAAKKQYYAEHRLVYVDNVPQIREVMAAGIGRIAVKNDDGFVNLVSGKTVASGVNKKTLEQLSQRYTIVVTNGGVDCLCTLKPEYTLGREESACPRTVSTNAAEDKN